MPEFKRLKLQRDKIIPIIESTYAPCTVEIKKNNDINYTYNVKIDKEIAMLSIYFNPTDETTTINYMVGSNQTLSYELAKTIKEHCSLKEVLVSSFYIKKINKPELETVLEFVQEKGANIEEKKDIGTGIQYKIKGKHGGHITLKHFNTLSLQIQGKAALLFDDIIEILSELLPFKEVIEQQLKFYSANLTAGDILGEMENRIPIAFPHLHDKIKSIISPCFALKKIQGIEIGDYSSFAFPALRGLEGILKDLLAPKCIPDNKKEGFGEFFEFNNTHLKHFLNNETKAIIKDENKCRNIEKVYNYYSTQRHSLFHVDNMIELTRTLSRNEAETIINSILNIIDDVYA
ncbi:MAG: type II toxin-antitoxin system RnlA family toxin [Bacteroidetes bacterium]|nr:type II toxin-antitoxin system RnlA family toxin [Bacteroidota bacterium]